MTKSTKDGSAVSSNEEGVQHQNTNTPSAPQDTQQQQQQPSSQQHSNVEPLFSGDPTTQVAAHFAESSSPYQQQPQRVFGQVLPIIGPNRFVLDKEFQAATQKSHMLWAFMQAINQAEEEQQSRNSRARTAKAG
jgi:hypothetical protein